MINREIVGRSPEKTILSEVFESKNAEFVAVYGRRRIGKTYLIETYFADKACLYFSITGLRGGSLKQQLALFTAKMSEIFFADIGVQVEAPSDWMHAFDLLTKALSKFAGDKKIVLFFDELPWLAAKKSGFKDALDYYWNTKWSKDERIRLIVCGSAASWIIKNIINDKGGLHNRVTVKIALYPFTLKETFEYLHYIGVRYNQQQTLELYMALGGVPHYLQRIKPSLSAAQNISLLCFSRNGHLFDEFDKLFSSLFDKAQAYVELVKLIAIKRSGVTRNELEKKSKLSSSGGTLTERLSALEQAGFIKSFFPIGYEERGLSFKLIDEYCLFYLLWIYPIKSKVSSEAVSDYWVSKINTPAWHNWSGYAFEAVCLKHVTQIKRALYIPAGSLSGSWHYQPESVKLTEGAQIDLLFDRDDGVVTLCEIKYTQNPFVINKKYAADLQRKVRVFKENTKTNKQLFLSLVVSADLKINQYSEELITGKAVLSDLFES
jgi:predicted AAA+ superfamily ATPase